MEISVVIKVSSHEELDQVTAAVGPLIMAASVSHDVTETVADGDTGPAPAPVRKRATRSSKPAQETQKFDAPPASEPMTEVPSKFAGQALASEHPVSLQAAQVANVVAQAFPNAVEHIKAEAARLEGMTYIPVEAKRGLINALKIEVGGPQEKPASQLPEPYLSVFASRFTDTINRTSAQYGVVIGGVANAGALV